MFPFYTISLFNQFNIDTFGLYLKLISTILIFFAAHTVTNYEKLLKILAISYILPLIINVGLGLSGNGYTYWGNVYTFVGTYYYKTDLAIAAFLGAVFLRKYIVFSKNKTQLLVSIALIFGVTPYLIIMSNSRMFLILYAFLAIVIISEYFKLNSFKTENRKRRYKLSKGVVLLITIVAILTVSSSYLFYNNASASSGVLTISFEPDEIFSEQNTQGRSVIWDSAISAISNSSPTQLMFGHYLNSDFDLIRDNRQARDAHNNFLKLTLNIGIIGCTIFLLFTFTIIRLMRMAKKQVKIKPELNFLVNTILLLFCFFYIAGMTQSNIVYTQSSWYAFFFFGLLSNKYIFSAPNKEI